MIAIPPPVPASPDALLARARRAARLARGRDGARRQLGGGAGRAGPAGA